MLVTLPERPDADGRHRRRLDSRRLRHRRSRARPRAARPRHRRGWTTSPITHGDPDHIGGAASLAATSRRARSGTACSSPTTSRPMKLQCDGRRASVRRGARCRRGDRLDIGGVELRVHHPPPPDWERQKVRNDDSLVIELRYGQVSMLLTGDIGREVEQALHPDARPAADRRLEVAAPRQRHLELGGVRRGDQAATSCVISCGRGNPYGHPVPYVLERYRAVERKSSDRSGRADRGRHRRQRLRSRRSRAGRCRAVNAEGTTRRRLDALGAFASRRVDSVMRAWSSTELDRLHVGSIAHGCTTREPSREFARRRSIARAARRRLVELNDAVEPSITSRADRC